MRSDRSRGLSAAVRRKPLQAAKVAGIVLVLVAGVAGFFRVVDAMAVTDNPLLGDGQFLALVLLPLLSLVLVLVVFVETVVSGYRVLRAEETLAEQVTGRVGYTVVRGAEAAIAVAGVATMAAAVPVLFADATPAPAGVGVMLLLLVVGVGIFVASLVRATAELVVWKGPRADRDGSRDAG